MAGAYFFARVRASSTIVMRWQVALWRRLRRRPPFYGARINAILSDLAHTGPSRRAAHIFVACARASSRSLWAMVRGSESNLLTAQRDKMARGPA